MSSSPASAPAVSLAAVSKSFGAVTALQATSLDIGQGELMTLLGPSGCGKTTLLNIVAGFLSADSGDVAIDGRRVNEVPTFQREIGMMFQSYALFPHMTVEANVGYGLRMRGLAKAEIRKRVADALALVKLQGLEGRRPSQLSGGQQQRIALARALVIEPKVLLLDEPFSALDKALRGSMQIELKDIQRKLGIATIFVTHDQGEALSLSDRLAVMSEGVIRQVGTPEEVYARPADRFVASFIGDVNVLPGIVASLDGQQATVRVGTARAIVPRAHLAGAAAGMEVDVFVRPEQMALVPPSEEAALTGRVHACVFQGGHTDVLVDLGPPEAPPVLVRLAGASQVGRWRAQDAVGLALAAEAVLAFPRGS
ncbi:MAG: ABC transporter ATP-binding protein [Hyphomicrobiaceae bacterium]|nr:ABC transporter ATP-binding protein [Hyphomicrobiaceae bacterium]